MFIYRMVSLWLSHPGGHQDNFIIHNTIHYAIFPKIIYLNLTQQLVTLSRVIQSFTVTTFRTNLPIHRSPALRPSPEPSFCEFTQIPPRFISGTKRPVETTDIKLYFVNIRQWPQKLVLSIFVTSIKMKREDSLTGGTTGLRREGSNYELILNVKSLFRTVKIGFYIVVLYYYIWWCICNNVFE